MRNFLALSTQAVRLKKKLFSQNAFFFPIKKNESLGYHYFTFDIVFFFIFTGEVFLIYSVYL